MTVHPGIMAGRVEDKEDKGRGQCEEEPAGPQCLECPSTASSHACERIHFFVVSWDGPKWKSILTLMEWWWWAKLMSGPGVEGGR